jgi:hypothetical protein
MSRLKKIAVFGVILAALAAIFYTLYRKFVGKNEVN